MYNAKQFGKARKLYSSGSRISDGNKLVEIDDLDFLADARRRPGDKMYIGPVELKPLKAIFDGPDVVHQYCHATFQGGELNGYGRFVQSRGVWQLETDIYPIG